MNSNSTIIFIVLLVLLIALVPFALGVMLRIIFRKKEIPAFIPWLISGTILTFTSYFSPHRAVILLPAMAEQNRLLKFGIFLATIIIYATMIKQGIDFGRNKSKQQNNSIKSDGE